MTKTIKITMIGDILCDNFFYATKYEKNGKYDFIDIFRPIKKVLLKSDFVLANLETPIALENINLTNKMYEFNSPFEFALAIKKMGVDCVSTANNHCLDRNITGLFSTIDSLDKIGLKHTGTFKTNGEKKYLVQNICGLKIGILSFTYGTNAFSNNNYLSFKNRKLVNLTQEQENWFDRYKIIGRFLKKWPNSILFRLYKKIYRTLNKRNEGMQVYERRTFDGYRKCLMAKIIRRAKKECDFTIAYLHIGGQYNTEPAEYTKKTINFFQNKGVNVVVANHEHVIHGIKNNIKENQFATYAIGNFLGSAGVKHAPFDRNADYSIILHAYIDKDTQTIHSMTFTVTKTILLKNDKYIVVPVCDYLKGLNGFENKKMKENVLQIAYEFSGKKYEKVVEEFEL